MTSDEAETIAIMALQHISGDPDLLSLFMDLSGLSPNDFRQAASQPGFFSAVLEFLRQNEAECLTFTANFGLSANSITNAAQVLSHSNLKSMDF